MQDDNDAPDNTGLFDQISANIEAGVNAAENAAVARVGEIQMITIMDSSDIAEAGYDPIGFRAQILFRTGRMYMISNVSPIDWDGFITAPSKGKYFWGWRRNPLQYPWTRLQ